MAIKHSLVCDTLSFMGYDVLDEPDLVLGAIKAAGYDGADLPGYSDKVDAKLLKQKVDELGLEVPGVLGAWGYYHAGENRDLVGSGDEVRRKAIEYSKKSLDQASVFGAKFFEVCAGQPGIPQLPWPVEPVDTLRQRFAAAVVEICEHASPLGITVLLEPLNLYEGYPGVLTTLDEATRFIEDLNLDNLGLQPDCYHMNIGETSVPEALRACGKHARVLHLNESQHRELGSGHIDYRAVLEALKEVGFSGYFSIYAPISTQEAFQANKGSGYGSAEGAAARDAARPDLESVLQRQVEFIKKIEDEVGI